MNLENLDTFTITFEDQSVTLPVPDGAWMLDDQLRITMVDGKFCILVRWKTRARGDYWHSCPIAGFDEESITALKAAMELSC